jgi:hypothetical protein
MNCVRTERTRPKPACARLYASATPGAGQPLPRPARCCATLRVNGTGCRAVPWFEGAHSLRRCAPFSKSAHLGKSRRFLRRCAPLSKVRTENCASSQFLTPRSFGLVVTGRAHRFLWGLSCATNLQPCTETGIRPPTPPNERTYPHRSDTEPSYCRAVLPCGRQTANIFLAGTNCAADRKQLRSG